MKKIILYSPFDLSINAIKVLSLLYLPLIGSKAFSLYLSIYSLYYQSKNKAYSKMFFLEHLKLTNEEFQKSRHILESFDLLNTFISEKDHYLIKVKKPLTPKQFLSDTIFGSFFEAEMGEKFTSKIVSTFEVNSPEFLESNNISKSFSDLYKFKQMQNPSFDLNLYENGNSKRKNFVEQFPFEEWFESIPKRFQKPILMRKSMRDLIENLVLVYNFSSEDMTNIIQMLKPNQVTKVSLNLKARFYFQEKMMKLDVVEKSTDVNNTLDKVSPLTILKKYSKNDDYSQSLEDVVNLMDRNNVNLGIINTLILFVLKRKNGIMPHINYLEKILNDWLSKGVRNTNDATKLVSKIEKNFSNKSQKTRKNIQPDWFEDYLKELENVKEAV